MSRKSLAAITPVLAIVAFVALPAMAQAVTLRNVATGANLAAGAPLNGSSNNLKFATAGGPTLECEVNEIAGKVSENPGATALIEGGTFTAAGGGACPTNVAGLTAAITPENFNWTAIFAQLGESGIAAVNRVQFKAELSAGQKCKFGGAVGGSYKFGVPLGLNVGPSKLRLIETIVGPCPPEGTLTGEFTVTTTKGAGVEAVTP